MHLPGYGSLATGQDHGHIEGLSHLAAHAKACGAFLSIGSIPTPGNWIQTLPYWSQGPAAPFCRATPLIPVISPCPTCEGSGLLITTDARGNRFAHDCQCRVQSRAQRLLAESRIPRRYADCSLDAFEYGGHKSLAEAYLMAHKFAINFPLETRGLGLLFTGSAGLGKTHLASSILKYVIQERGATGLFWEHKELLERLRSFYDLRTAGGENKFLRSIIECDLLVLDDLGEVGNNSEWVLDTTSYILNSRYNESRSTLVTTNRRNEASLSLSREDGQSQFQGDRDARAARRQTSLGDAITDRMFSRLQEMCVVLEMEGRDYRRSEKRAQFR